MFGMPRFGPAWLVIVLASPALAQDPDYGLSIEDESGDVGGMRGVRVWLRNDGESVEGYQFDVCHDGFVAIDVDGIELGAGMAGIALDTHVVSAEDEGWSVSATLSAGTPLEPDPLSELYVATYELVEIGLASLTFCGTYAEPRVVAGGLEIEPETTDGSIDVVPVREFLRGDANGDGRVDPLIDGMFMM